MQGDVSPPVDDLEAEWLDSIVALLARVLYTYEEADLESFLTWHARDLESAGSGRADDVQRLREYVKQLDPAADVPDDWVGALTVFWKAYYQSPPVARFLPETTRLRFARGKIVAESWNHSFDAFRAENSGNHIAHRLVIPHRRSPEDATNELGELVWMDFVIDFQTPHGVSARLIARFVWDARDDAWFLYRAATSSLDASRDIPERRHLIL